MRKLTTLELNRVSPKTFSGLQKYPLVILLDNVRSGHNVGAAFRIADAFLIEKIYLCGIAPKPPHAAIHKTALGAEFCVTWDYVPTAIQALQQLKAANYTIVGIEQTDNSIDLKTFSPAADKKYCLVFGHEVFGVSEEVLAACDFSIVIPQEGTKHSLNVAVSMGIVLWEFRKGMEKV